MRWTYLKWSIAFWWGFAWSFAGVVLTLVAGHLWSRYEARSRDFYEVRGTITDKFHGRNKSHTPELLVGYLARDGRPYSTVVDVSAADWEQYRLGGEVMLYVAGDRPDDAWPESDGGPSTSAAWILTVLASLFIVPGPLTFLYGLRTASARARALESGQPIEGRVKRIEGSGWTINRVRYSCYRYSWRGLDGVERSATSLPIHPDRVTMHDGDPVTVFVDPSAPERGEIRL